MKRPVVALASVLKPLNDTRMYGKIGLSLGESTKYDVKIIGFSANKPLNARNINFFPIPFFKRLSAGRLAAHIYIFRTLFRLKPDLVIITTYELLPVSLMIRLITGAAIIYDVQENYALNIRTQTHTPKFLRWPLSALVRLTERIHAPFVRHFILAEKVYAGQLRSFVSGKYTVLENKSAQTTPTHYQKQHIRKLLFTGTLGRHTGVLEVIQWISGLVEFLPVSLHIAGYAPDERFQDVLRKEISRKDFISASGMDHLLPHQVIQEAIRQADAGLVSNPLHPSNQGKIPTKLYEYLAGGLPVILADRPEWRRLTTPYNAAFFVDFKQIPDIRTAKNLESHTFYTRIPGCEVRWKSEVPKLLEVVSKCLSKH